MNNSKKAFHSPAESTNLSSDQQNLIPLPTYFIFTTLNLATLHLLNPKQTKEPPITLISRDHIAQLSPENANTFPINASIPIPYSP